MLQELALGAAIDFGTQWGLWVVAALLKTEKFYDLADVYSWGSEDECPIAGGEVVGPGATNIFGSGTFVLLANLSLRWGNTWHLRQKIQTGLVTVWGLRLGGFLFLRILREGQDKRFNHARENPGTFFVYWTVQGVWIFVTLLPTLILNLEKLDQRLCVLDYLGWAIWAVGFITQSVADQQKWSFKADPDNAGKFIHSGLWAYSRHPNYLGEVLQWTGHFLSASRVFSGLQFISIVSPLFVWFLLSYVSGVPILENQALKRWGEDPAYQKYMKKTPVLWPFTS